MKLVEPKKSNDYYIKPGTRTIVRQENKLIPGPAVPFGAGISLVGLFILAPLSAPLAIILILLSSVLLVSAVVIGAASGLRGILAYRGEQPIATMKPDSSTLTQSMVDHPKYQQALRDFECSGRIMNSHWSNELSLLAMSIKRNQELLAEQQQELLPSGYHIDVDVHNEMLSPRAIVVSEPEKQETKSIDPKSVGVNLHLKYKELEIIRNALRRDPYFNSEEHKSLNKRLLKARAKVDDSASFDAPVSNSKCQHEKLKEQLKPGEFAKCSYCIATFEYPALEDHRMQKCIHKRFDFVESWDDYDSDRMVCLDCGEEGDW